MTVTGNLDGRAELAREMARQHDDALASYDANQTRAAELAASIRETGRLTLLGMGGSHWVNRTMLGLYRGLGIEVAAEVLSEALVTPLPPRPRTVLITSQSGGSGEIAPYLDRAAPEEQRFGITLGADSVLGRGVPCLCGVGGPELAFAATRSILICQALHGAVLGALGYDTRAARAQLADPVTADVRAALAHLRAAQVLVLSGRDVLQGVAENGALCMMELARMPSLAFEGGQLRHGPIEMLSDGMGVVVLRPAGPASALSRRLAEDLAQICPVVVIDLSGEAPAQGAVTIALPEAHGLAAAHLALPVMQLLLIEMAGERVENLGKPVRSVKVTTTL